MREMDVKLREAFETLDIRPGDIYESCSYEPVLCLGANYQADEIWGISLIDGRQPCACSLLHCGVRKLTLQEAWQIKVAGPSSEEIRQSIKPESRWWSAAAASQTWSVSLTPPSLVPAGGGNP